MTDKTGGPAFPCNDDHIFCREGMTLRDWFAGHTLTMINFGNSEFGYPSEEDLAANAYKIADAMLKEREDG